MRRDEKVHIRDQSERRFVGDASIRTNLGQISRILARKAKLDELVFGNCFSLRNPNRINFLV